MGTYIRALRSELGDTLALGELSELRAASLNGVDREAQVKAHQRMECLIEAGLLEVERRQVEEPTGRWIYIEPYDYRRHGPVDREQDRRMVSDRRVPNSTPEKRQRTEIRITRAQARALHVRDPHCWGDEALKWAGLNVEATDVPEPEGEWLSQADAFERLEAAGLTKEGDTSVRFFRNAAISVWMAPALHPNRKQGDTRVDIRVLEPLVRERAADRGKRQAQQKPQTAPSPWPSTVHKIGR